MSIADHTAIAMAVPAYDTDKIIGVLEGSLACSAPAAFSFSSANTTHDTGFGEACLFQGIFSMDGGTTWNDFGAQLPDTSDSSFVQPQTLDCNATMLDGDLRVVATNWYNSVASTSTARTATYKVALYTRKNQGDIERLPISQVLAYRTSRNFQKIAFDDSVAFSLSTSDDQTATVLHNLGYIPRVRAFFVRDDNGRVVPLGFVDAAAGEDYYVEVRVDTTTVTFFQDASFASMNVAGRIEYRVYLDD